MGIMEKKLRMKKNKTLKVFIGMAICLTVGLFSCSEEEKTKDEQKKEAVEEKKPDLHLREMMRLLYNDMQANRQKILAGNEEMHFSFDYATMPLAEATTEENKGKESYDSNMKHYIDLSQKLAESRDNLKRVEYFNEMRATCIACHQEYCIGPLRKIDKILVLSNEILRDAQFKN